MFTTQTLYQNEVRGVKINLSKSDDSLLNPDSVFATIYDRDGNVVQAEQTCSLSSSVATAIVDTDTTGNTGDYEIIWKVNKGSYIYYHKTELVVLSL